ncbi:MAG: DUF2298 domain-containing protein, partial [Anaerolineae bacterium]|nr:DUF2298 domain-containing protein [Anaerolineae bacterium]
EGPLALLIPPAALALGLWLRARGSVAERLGALLAAAACLILACTELAFLQDFLRGGEWQRMNTVFKFGIQAWVLVALGVGAGLPEVLAWVRARRTIVPVAWAGAMAGLLAISLAYVPLGLVARVNERFPGGPPPTGTLDGLAYMQTGVYNWPDPEDSIVLRYDYDAIRWLLANVRGTPVIAEAPLGYYREGGMRVSSYTGLPTLVGAHQAEQRAPEAVAERARQADALYRSEDIEETLALLRQLRVQYVYLGQLEEVVYGPAPRAKFEELARRGELEVAYLNERVVIYRVVTPPPGAGDAEGREASQARRPALSREAYRLEALPHPDPSPKGAAARSEACPLRRAGRNRRRGIGVRIPNGAIDTAPTFPIIGLWTPRAARLAGR